MATVSVRMIPKGRVWMNWGDTAIFRFGPDKGRHRQLIDYRNGDPTWPVSQFPDDKSPAAIYSPQKIRAAVIAAAIRDGLVTAIVQL